MTFHLKAFTILVLVATISKATAQSEKHSDIYQVLKAKDSVLFQVGFNKCNLDIIDKLVTSDIEFYHDKDGITTSKEKFITSIKNNLCNSGENSSMRILEETSFEVFPLYKGKELYGVIQNGIHYFGQTQASYSHLWLKKDNDWKLSRVLSYNHHQKQNTSKNNRIPLTKEELKKYIGAYEFSPEFVLTVSIKDGALYGGSQGQDVKIHCYNKHKFIDDEQTSDLEFITDPNGVVTGLHMKSSGMEMTANKK